MTRIASKLWIVATALSCPYLALAESVESTRPIKAHSVLTIDDLVLAEETIPGAINSIQDAVGLEARKTLYPGRPIMVGDVGPVTAIERNELVELVFTHGPLRITTEGRALGRASIGQRIRVMNSDSRLTVTGVVVAPTIVEVKN